MKTKHLTIAAAVLISMAGYSQKEELKTLKKIYEKETPTAKDITDYRAALDQGSPLMGAATPAEKAYFEFYKAARPVVEMNTAVNKVNPQAALRNVTANDIKAFASASAAVIELEKSAEKKQMTPVVKKTISTVKPLLLDYAVKLGDQKKFAEAAEVLYAIYQMDKSDADNLYYAANYAVNATDHEAALRYYNELRDINYSGEGTLYYATAVTNDQEQVFTTEAEMNKFIALKTHTKPRKEAVPSKRGEIYKNIALILLAQGKNDEAKAAISKARIENPDDTSLILAEAEMYLKLNDMDSYKKTIAQVLEKNPNDPVQTYNLGVVTLNSGQSAEAEKYFLRAIELDPTNANAYINVAVVKLQADAKLVESMNKLGNSTADNKKYDALKAERNKLFQAVLPYLEKAHELEPANETVIDNLASVYNYLEMKEKYQAIKAKRK